MVWISGICKFMLDNYLEIFADMGKVRIFATRKRRNAVVH